MAKGLSPSIAHTDTCVVCYTYERMSKRNEERIRKMVDTYLEFQDVIWELQRRQDALLEKIEKRTEETKLAELKEQLANITEQKQ